MIWAWMMSFGLAFPFLAVRAERAYRAMKTLPAQPQIPGELPSVSIIVPARNEEINLPHLLPSLLAQHYPGKTEIIVINDHSSDRTAEIAASLGTKVISLDTLPDGWYGKPNACHQGALAAKGEWLLFTDADTWHEPNTLAAAVHYAMTHELHGLSLLLKEISSGFAAKLAMMTGFAALFAGMLSGHPIMNGQFILIRRDVYNAVNGFAAVRSEAIEDFALAHLLQTHNFRARILLGQQAATVRTYRNFGHLWQGFSRLGSGALHWSGNGGWLTALFITGALLPLVAIPLTILAEMPIGWLVTSWAAAALAFLPWAKRASAWPFALLAPFGALIVMLATINGLLKSNFGQGIHWKGRKV